MPKKSTSSTTPKTTKTTKITNTTTSKTAKAVKAPKPAYDSDKEYTVQVRLNVRSTPSLTAAIVTVLSPNDKVIALDVKEDGANIWIQLTNGWCLAKKGASVFVK